MIQKHRFISNSTIAIYVNIIFKNSTAFLHDYCSALTKHELKSALFPPLFAFPFSFHFIPIQLFLMLSMEITKWVLIFICSVPSILQAVILVGTLGLE